MRNCNQFQIEKCPLTPPAPRPKCHSFPPKRSRYDCRSGNLVAGFKVHLIHSCTKRKQTYLPFSCNSAHSQCSLQLQDYSLLLGKPALPLCITSHPAWTVVEPCFSNSSLCWLSPTPNQHTSILLFPLSYKSLLLILF